jgi:hypothetical protein
MNIETVKAYIEETGLKDVSLFDEPNFETAIIGISDNDQVIYDYELMVEYLVRYCDMTFEEAEDYIEFKTVDSLKTMTGRKPIILNRFEYD